MNCSHCKAQWTPPPNKSVSTCPFCGKPLVDPADVSVDTKPEVILRQVVERFDMAILGERRLSAILKDLMPHVERKYLRIFTQAINDGIGEKLLRLTNETNEVRTATLHTLKDSFRQHNGYDHTADYVVDCFLYALGLLNKVEEQQTQHGINPNNLLNQQIELAFADNVLTKDEARLLFQAAHAMGIAEETVIEAIEERIKTLNLKPVNLVDSAIKKNKDKICRTDWVENSDDNNVKKETYKSVKIGNQTWMAENLSIAHFRNGDPIPEAKTNEEWITAGEQGKPAWCYYDNDPANGKKYGKLYNWFAVNDPRGLAPEGWHIPSEKGWTQLTHFLGSDDYEASIKLKAQVGWIKEGNGTNVFDFSALPGGGRSNDGVFYGLGSDGNWWCFKVSSPDDDWYRYVNFNYNSVGWFLENDKWGFSVRCVKDTEIEIIKEVTIGNQIWMAENLNVSHFRNGDPIPEAQTNEEWEAAGEQGKPVWCFYENDPDNGKKYGKLYNWYAVNDAKGLAPEGWHVPSDAEWTELTNFVGSNSGSKLKTKSGYSNNGNGTDDYGFSALPGGCRYANGAFNDIGDDGGWWSSTEDSANKAWGRRMYYGYSSVGRLNYYKEVGFSVRCIKV